MGGLPDSCIHLYARVHPSVSAPFHSSAGQLPVPTSNFPAWPTAVASQGHTTAVAPISSSFLNFLTPMGQWQQQPQPQQQQMPPPQQQQQLWHTSVQPQSSSPSTSHSAAWSAPGPAAADLHRDIQGPTRGKYISVLPYEHEHLSVGVGHGCSILSHWKTFCLYKSKYFV